MAAINFDQPSKGQVSSAETALNVVNTGGGIGVIGEGGVGVVGKSKNWVGVFGQSETYQGVLGESMSGAGVVGVSTGGGIGVFAKGTTAGRFEGDVDFQGNVQVTGDIRLLNADCAEDFDISSSENVEAGTVMVLNEDGEVQPSHQAYDKKAAGVISGAGDYKPGIILGRQDFESKRIPIALMGKVFCKVDANYSCIEVGDLLTTSNTLGHAMKAADPLKAFGAVIGKALASLKEGQGMVPILVALQ